MKKRYARCLAALFLILAAVSAYSYLHVDGREIDSLSAISEDYTVTVTKTHATLSREQTEYTLNRDQVLQLKALIANSSFTRNLSSGFSYSGLKDTYRIIFERTDPQGKQLDYIYAYCVEDLNLWISFAYGGEDLNLKINNPQWHAALEAILTNS